MKKQLYTAPATQVVRVETMTMIAASTETLSVNQTEEVNSVGDLLSRHRNSLWDDEEVDD